MKKFAFPWRLALGVFIFGCACAGVSFVVLSRASFPRVSGAFPLKEVWSYDAREPIVAVSASETGTLVIRTASSTIGLDVASRAQLWTTPIGSQIYPAPAKFQDGKVFLANKTGVWALAERTGKILWNRPVTWSSDGRVIALSACCVFVHRTSKDLTVYDVLNGQTLWSIPVGRGLITAQAQDGVVFVADRGIQA